MGRKIEPSTLKTKIERNNLVIKDLKDKLILHTQMVNYRIERLELEVKKSQTLLDILDPRLKETRF